MEESANCASSSRRSKLLGTTEKGMRSLRSLKPKPAAVLVMPSSPTSTPSFAKTVLQDQVKAYRREASPQPSVSFVSLVVVPGSRYGSGDLVGASTSPTTPESSAAAAVSTLN